MIALAILSIVVIATRIFQVYKFFKLVSKLCHIYDRNYLNEHGDTNVRLVLDYMTKDYHLTAEWSAYKWMFFKGPHPLLMFFSFESLTIEGQYGKEVVDRLTEYRVFEDLEWKKQNK